MIDLGDGVEVLAIWYVSIGRRGDWLAIVSRKAAEDPRWVFKYRFRWYQEPRRAFDSDDVKNWYRAYVDAGELPGETVGKVDLVAAFIAQANQGTVDRILVQGDGRKALELMEKRPWAHVRREPIS